MIIYVPAKAIGNAPAFGRIEKGHPAHGKYRGFVTRALEEPFALLIAK